MSGGARNAATDAPYNISDARDAPSGIRPTLPKLALGIRRQTVMLDQHISKTDVELWQRFIEAEHQLSSAREKLFSETSSLVPLVRAGLERPSERVEALRVAATLPIERRQELLPDLLALATYVHGLTGEARHIILTLPHDWLLTNIENYAEPLLAHDDFEEYTGLLELYSHIDRILTLRLAHQASNHIDPDIKEVGQDFLANPYPHRPLR